jgi:hypothetical protein
MQKHKQEISYVISLILAVIVATSPAYGAWAAKEILVNGSWGNSPTEFGLSRGDTLAYDMWPVSINLFPLGKIFIDDDVNKRTNVYTIDGVYIENILWKETVTTKYVEYERTKYVIDGTLAGYGASNSFWANDNGTFRKYDSSFVLQETVATRPLDLGKLTSKKLPSSQWRYVIEYPDGIYTYEGAQDAIKEVGLLRVNANLIIQNLKSKVIAYRTTEELPTLPNEKKRYKLAMAAEWTKPKDEFGPVRVVGVERLPTLVAQYGEAVLGPDGSIYTWMRTDTNYKILRWKWMEQ